MSARRDENSGVNRRGARQSRNQTRREEKKKKETRLSRSALRWIGPATRPRVVLAKPRRAASLPLSETENILRQQNLGRAPPPSSWYPNHYQKWKGPRRGNGLASQRLHCKYAPGACPAPSIIGWILHCGAGNTTTARKKLRFSLVVFSGRVTEKVSHAEQVSAGGCLQLPRSSHSEPDAHPARPVVHH